MTKIFSQVTVLIDPECMRGIMEDFEKDVTAALADGWGIISSGMTNQYIYAFLTKEAA